MQFIKEQYNSYSFVKTASSFLNESHDPIERQAVIVYERMA